MSLPKEVESVIHTGKHFIWYIQQEAFQAYSEEIKPFFDYADRVCDKIAEWWGPIPIQTRFYLWVHNLREQEKDGFAGHISELDSVVGKRAVGVGVIDDAFFTTMHGVKGFRAYQLIAHETVNLLNALVASAGWPVDWWTNHRSPFPAMVSVEVERALVPEVSFHSEMWFRNPPPQSPPDKLPPELHQSSLRSKLLSLRTWAEETKAVEEEQRLYRMFKDLKDMYGWIMFRKMFAMMRGDGIDLQRIGENPSTLLTSYVTAYLTLGAGEDISDYFHSGGVPTFDSEMMQAIISARQRLIDSGDNATAVGWPLFRQGNYKEILKVIEKAKNQNITKTLEVMLWKEQEHPRRKFPV